MSATASPGTVPPRRQNRMTRRSVLVKDRIANWTIRIGGILVIFAVAAIMLFLLYVVVPLFTGGRVDSVRQYRVPGLTAQVAMTTADEYRTIGLALGRDGTMQGWHLQTGRALEVPDFDFGSVRATAFARTINRSNLAFGFENGTVRFGAVTLPAEILGGDAAPAGAERLDARDVTDGQAVFSTIPGGQLRRISVAARLDPPQQVAPPGTAIIAMDYRRGGTAERPTISFVTADANNTLRLSRAESRLNIMTRQMRTTISTSELPALPAGTEIKALLLTDQADMVLVGTAAGEVFRYDTRDFNAPRLAETLRVVPQGERLTGLYFLIGEQSLIAAGDRGTMDVFFRLSGGTDTADGLRMVRAHALERQPAATDAVAASQRGKMFLTADTRGNVWLRHTTSEQVMLRLAKDGGAESFAAIALTPRDDGILAIAADGRVTLWNIDVPHPETTLGTIFGRVWYEGYDGPSWTWQSSAGTDQFEPKLSLVPLIFGTIKATVYALIFAIPVALLAAIYTSEFLHRRVRAVVKPAMEMMASLPSVVLGFIAALILAPIVEDIVPAVIFGLVLLPLSFIAAAHLWQLLPRPVLLRHAGLTKLALIFVCLFAGFWLAAVLGRPFERIVFGGDVKAWLNGDLAGAVGFIAFLLFPASALVVALLGQRALGDLLDRMAGHGSRLRVAVAALLRWVGLTAGAVALAIGVAMLLAAAGFDPRGGIVGTYVQRNTLVVGFAMGFAVIPIIYTISEDALNSVPEHLRSASLACGATPWQTATRIILPTAASGVFAAVMIGMGRAVGETMIVVMAAGNTPILDWNIFNGLRALSANIAVELPEAVRDGTLYRMLFLAALTLFVMTFVVNTLAEVIRLRFRRRAASL
jgi:phosphate transport system permease protein